MFIVWSYLQATIWLSKRDRGGKRMNDFYESPQSQSQSHSNENIRVKQAGNSKFKSFLSLVAAGIIGSAATLTMISVMDIGQELKVQEDSMTEDSENQKALLPTINPTQVTAKTNSASLADMIDGASKAIVGIVNLQKNLNDFWAHTGNVESGSGSGVIFKKTADAAYIVTNNHVIEGANEIQVSLHNGERVSAEVVGTDALTDLAVLKIDPKLVSSVIEFGDSTKLRPGDQVLAIGNPLGLDLSRTVTQGIVSAMDRTISVSTSAGDWDLNVIQTDAAINPGNSGGALINTDGQVIGINSLKISQSGIEGLGFAIPSHDVLPIVNEMIENGKVNRPYLGVSLVGLDEVPREYLENLPKSVESGAVVSYIDPVSPAATAGLKRADVIIAINNQEIKTSGDVRKYLYSKLKVGDDVTIKLYREGELRTVQLKLTSNQPTN
jgi:serine protease Do